MTTLTVFLSHASVVRLIPLVLNDQPLVPGLQLASAELRPKKIEYHFSSNENYES
jgi:hypothetical protein